MSAPIGPGDYVECVKARGLYRAFSVGSVHRICEIGPVGECPACGRCAGLLFTDVPPPPLAQGSHWSACCFRPIYRRSDKILKSVLLPVDEEAHA